MAGKLFNNLTGMSVNENYILKQYVTSRLNCIIYGKPEGGSGSLSFFLTHKEAQISIF